MPLTIGEISYTSLSRTACQVPAPPNSLVAHSGACGYQGFVVRGVKVSEFSAPYHGLSLAFGLTRTHTGTATTNTELKS